MKLFSSELGQNYGSYTFGYTNYCLREAGDSLADIYARGFLPYSGSCDTKDVFYMARSARVDLKNLVQTSENRRIAKKFDGSFEKTCTPLSAFSVDEEFFAFCLNYFAQKHGAAAMPRERLEFILGCGLVSTVVTYSKNKKPVAYVLEVSDTEMGHYWFSFYDLSLARQSLGLWLMRDALHSGAEAGLKYYYLGTVYGEKALYKTNFEPLGWWGGVSWSIDVALLKERGRSDNERHEALVDVWKKDQKLF